MAHDRIGKDIADTVADIAEVQRLNGPLLITYRFRTDCTIRTTAWSRLEGNERVTKERAGAGGLQPEAGHASRAEVALARLSAG
jgi:hypothetical protein